MPMRAMQEHLERRRHPLYVIEGDGRDPVKVGRLEKRADGMNGGRALVFLALYTLMLVGLAVGLWLGGVL